MFVGLFDTINIVSIILFAAGLGLLLVEMFLPGFGIFGGLGLLCLVLCIVFLARSVEEALVLALILGAVVALILFVFARSLRKGLLYKSSIVLKNTSARDEGFVSNEDYSRLLGKTGKSVTVLRPAGIAMFGTEKVDVVTDGEFIPKDATVEVVEVAGRRVAVRKAQHEHADKSSSITGSGSAIDM